jgi:thioesterase DpgC
MEGSAHTKPIEGSGPDGVLKRHLAEAGLPAKQIGAWIKTKPAFGGQLKRDIADGQKYWRDAAALLTKLPKKPNRSPEQQLAVEGILQASRRSREDFLTRHADAIYRKLTANHGRFLRVDDLCYGASKLIPGLVPTKKEVLAEAELMQSQKDGVEINQGIFLAHMLADPKNGLHLCHAMLLPKPESIDHALRFMKDDLVELGPARLERKGKAAILTINNARYLNAEDDGTLAETETLADAAILDATNQICVLRGGKVDHPRYKDRNIFSAGINLTHIYRGKIPFLWYIRRDMGVVNKMFCGVAREDVSPEETAGGTVEKPWVAQLDTFAIGGGCQYLLAMDYVVAGSDAYMTLPARKEGIIPGAANLRLTRFVGARAARQAILMGRRFDCDSPEGRLICDVVVAPGEVEQAVTKVCEDFTSSGVVSAAGNRRAFRVGEESLDDFRRYMAVYCREQAYCHFSPALIANLEKHWNAANRKI